jgi:hypothetical protein
MIYQLSYQLKIKKRKEKKMSNDPKKPLTEVPVKKGGKNLPPSRPKPSTPPPSQTPKRN